jgi:predicted RNase H-like nuclease (RuvC/YqgF family)
MKKQLLKLVNLIGSKKVLDLDNDGKIEALRDEVAGLFSKFKTMVDSLDKVNGELDGVISEEELSQEVEIERMERLIEETNARLKESKERISKAKKEKEVNEKMKEKVSEFVV